MIRKIEALGYRCLRDVEQELDSFHVLVGPNASGKSTFLDVPVFLGDLLRFGLREAAGMRSSNFYDLTWMRNGAPFELAVELELPGRGPAGRAGAPIARYEVAIGINPAGVLQILTEALWLDPPSPPARSMRSGFPQHRLPRSSILRAWSANGPGPEPAVVTPSRGAMTRFRSESDGSSTAFMLDEDRSALASLPEDLAQFPSSVWVKRALAKGTQRIELYSDSLRRPSPPGSPREFQPTGSNLPFAIEALKKADRTRFDRWIAHVRTALPEIRTVLTIDRPEDRQRYLMVEYTNGLQAPSWTVSDGTLRLLALTLVAYLDTPGAVYVIEEPENGIHPKAVECVHQALSSTYESQILCASHSNIVLSMSEPKNILCFAKDADGATDVVRGSDHPALVDWRNEIDLGSLFAAGVLG